MKPDPSNPFNTAPNDSSEQAENPFEQAARQAQAPSPFQQGEQAKPTPTRLPERRDQSQLSPSPFSIDTDTDIETEPELEKVELPPIRMSEPMEGFATPGKPADVPKASATPPPVPEGDPFVMPAPFEQPAPQPLAEVESAVAPAVSPVPHSPDERQLVLRAIFGVAHDLDRDEILQRASSLPGIVSVQVLGRAERAAFSVLRDGIQRLGHSAQLEIVSKEGSIELIQGETTTLVVLHEGDYRPGVREILTIVAREFSQVD